MNWGNVARLISVEVKSSRLVRSSKFRRYRESRVFHYLLYGGSFALGLAVGVSAGAFYEGLSGPELREMFDQGVHYLFPSLPTLVLLYSLVFTMMGQIQRIGVKSSIQAPYWLPITWEEHTLASTLAHLMGLPLASIIALGSALLSFCVFQGELLLASFTVFALLVSAFIASLTTEIFRVLQTRFIGAVYRSSGKAAVWVRFFGSLLFLILFYIVWFALTSGSNSITLIKSVAGTQETIWFIPYVWLGVSIASFIAEKHIQTLVFSLASIIFTLALFYLAVKLNSKFGLYEPPAITVSRVYLPKLGLLRKLGFTPLEAAVIRKDFKAFTRRRELMYIFVIPIVFTLMPLMQYLGVIGKPVPPNASPFLFIWITIGPGAITAITMGTMIIGEEGGSIQFIYSSPITATALVKCKYVFITIFSFTVTLVCGVIGFLMAHPALHLAISTLIESILLILALSSVSLEAGIRGADFTEVPRPKMVKPLTAFINMLLCLVLGLIILFPFILHLISLVTVNLGLPITFIPKTNLYFAVSISTAIALAITLISYKITLEKAREFLIKTETS